LKPRRLHPIHTHVRPAEGHGRVVGNSSRLMRADVLFAETAVVRVHARASPAANRFSDPRSLVVRLWDAGGRPRFGSRRAPSCWDRPSAGEKQAEYVALGAVSRVRRRTLARPGREISGG